MDAGSAYPPGPASVSREKSRGPPIALERRMDNQPHRQRIAALHQRSFDLACGVLRAYPKKSFLDEPSRVVWRQLIKAITSSTFNFEEADAASSDSDFLAKMRIALREVKEARVAIRLMVACELAGHGVVCRYEDEARQMALIFAKIIVNKKANMTRPRF
jgi:four helix bundle protein